MDVVVGFSDKASRGLKNISGQFSKTSKSISGKISGLVSKFGLLGGVGGVAGVGLAITKSISTFSSFEKAIANAASVTGATGEVFEDTKKHIASVSKELGETTVFSASQAANAFYDLASAGYDVATMTKDDLQPIMDLAAATQTDLTKTTEVVTSTLGQFGLGIESSSRIADVFAKTIGSSKATVEALELSLKYVGPVAKSMGMGIEEVNAVLGNLYNAGFKGEQAGTALRGAFSRLLNPTGASVEALAELGLTLEDVDPTTRDFADILDTLTAAGMDTNSAMKLFGVEAAPAMLALTDNTGGIRELEASLMDAGDTAETMAKNQLATFSGSITLLKSALEGIAITIGAAVAPYLKWLAEWLTAAIPKVKGFVGVLAEKLTPTFESMKDIVGSLITIFNNLTGGVDSNESAFTSFMPILDAVIFVLDGLVDVLAAVFGWFAEHPRITKMAIAIAAAVAMITMPVLAVGAAIAALSIAWDRDWMGIKAITQTAINAISGIINFYIAYIKTAISVFLDIITLNWSDAWNTMSAFIAEWGPRIVNAVKTIGTAIIAALVEGIKGALGAVYGIITGEVSVTSTIIGGLKSLLPGAKAEGAAVSVNVADGIGEKESTVAAAADSVTTTLDTELQKALVPANETGLSAALNMAAGIESGTSAVSAAAAAVVNAAKVEMDKIWALGQAEKSRTAGKAEQIEAEAAKGIEGAISGTILRKISESGALFEKRSTTEASSEREMENVYADHRAMADWITELPEHFYVEEGVWSGLSSEIQDILQDRVLGILADASTVSKVAGSYKGHKQYVRGIKEEAILGTLTEYVASLPGYARGGYIDRDQVARIHKGEYVIPERDMPALSGGKDIHITYNIGDIIGIDNLQSILGQHDQKLLQKLQSLI